jgi:hypothetical protein
MRGAMPPFHHKSSWRDAFLSTLYIFMTLFLVKHRDDFTFLQRFFLNSYRCLKLYFKKNYRQVKIFTTMKIHVIFWVV